MADLTHTRSKPERQLWDQLEDVHAGMLGLVKSDQHQQPMAPNVDEAGKSIWFFTKKDSDLFNALQQDPSARAEFCVVGTQNDYYASIIGALFEDRNQEKIDQFWNPVVAAWFEGGKEDPQMTLLKFQATEAAIWASSRNPLTFGWEIAKANVSGNEPELGVRTHISF